MPEKLGSDYRAAQRILAVAPLLVLLLSGCGAVAGAAGTAASGAASTVGSAAAGKALGN